VRKKRELNAIDVVQLLMAIAFKRAALIAGLSNAERINATLLDNDEKSFQE